MESGKGERGRREVLVVCRVATIEGDWPIGIFVWQTISTGRNPAVKGPGGGPHARTAEGRGWGERKGDCPVPILWLRNEMRHFNPQVKLCEQLSYLVLQVGLPLGLSVGLRVGL